MSALQALLVPILAGHGAAAALQVADVNVEAPVADEPARTRLDRLLDRANDQIGRASIYTCADRQARERFRALRDRYDALESRAEALLRRPVLATPRTGSCRSDYDHRKFSFHARRGAYALGRAETMIRRGETD